MFKGEEITNFICKFNVTQPLNAHFKDNDINSMNFSLSIGSVLIPLYGLIIFNFISRIMGLTISLKCYKSRSCRRFGMYIEPNKQSFWQESGIVFKEAFYELSIGVSLQSLMYFRFHDSFGYRYFGSPCDATQSGLSIVTLLLMIVLPLHAIKLRLGAKNVWERQKVMSDYPIYYDNLKINGYCCFHEVYCMINKAFTAFVLVYLSDFTIF